MAPNNGQNEFDPRSPVEHIDTRSKHKEVTEGIALCLSGGGYRAMLFHLGALWRLNELGYLKKLSRTSSVSGGSITSAVLGMNWSNLAFDDHGVARNFGSEVVGPVRHLAGKTIDRKSILVGIFTPGSISDKIADAYRKHLTPMLNGMEKIDWQILRQFAIGQVVINDRVDDFFPPVGGKMPRMQFRVAGYFLIENGKIRVWRDFGYPGAKQILEPAPKA